MCAWGGGGGGGAGRLCMYADLVACHNVWLNGRLMCYYNQHTCNRFRRNLGRLLHGMLRTMM